MRRADRLFRIVQLVRGRCLMTPAFLAERMGVSLRSIYRDIAALQAQGVPIEGEAGVGYCMRSGFALPPLMFDSREAQALVACVRIALPRIDAALGAHAELALAKIMGVLPTAERTAAERLGLFAGPSGPDAAVLGHLEPLREAIESRRTLRLDYRDPAGQRTQRVVRPLGCFFWGDVWTLATWCELRGDFRTFRLDRIEALHTLDATFRDEPGRTLPDLLRRYACEGLGD